MNRDEILKSVLPSKAQECTVTFITLMIDKLIDLGVLEMIDIGAIKMLAVNYEMYVQTSNALIEDGPIISDKHGHKKANPANRLVKDYGAQVFALLKEFGLTVKSRDLIRSMNPSVEDDNPIKLLLESRNEK